MTRLLIFEREFEPDKAHTQKMDAPQRQTAIVMFLMLGGSAVVTALSIGYVAHFDFGFSREEIRVPAVIGAGIIASLMAVGYFGKRLRKP